MQKPLNQPQGKSAALWLVLMFLFSFNFMSAGGYLLLLLMSVYSIIHLREFSFRITEIFLFLFGVEYFLFYLLWYQTVTFREMCNFLVAPWILHWIGRNMGYRYGRENLPVQLVSTLTLGFFSYIFLCMGYSLSVAPPTAGFRLMYTFWDHTPLSVTSGGLLFSLSIGTAMGQVTTQNTGWKRLLWLSVLGACVFFSFTWAHRTSICILCILILYNCLHALSSGNIAPIKKFTILAGILLLAAIGIFCLSFDVGGCWSWLQGQWLFQRLTNDAAANSLSRLSIWKSFFDQWLLYPFGGKQFDISASYVHNLWLDTYYLGGILPFAALVIATICIAIHIVQFRNVQLAQNNRRSIHILSNFYLATFLVCMLEPVISAYPYTFLAVILISGCIEGCLTQTASCK